MRRYYTVLITVKYTGWLADLKDPRLVVGNARNRVMYLPNVRARVGGLGITVTTV